MPIPTEPIGSIPRPQDLIDAIQAFQEGRISQETLDTEYRTAVVETIRLFEATGSPVITDGEQSKPSFATYPIHGAKNIASGGVTISFADGHQRELPVLISWPFRYTTYADQFLQFAQEYAHTPVKQAVISASALSLLYPPNGIPDYSQEQFLEDLVRENETDIRRCLEKGAHNVQIDFTEGRLAVKLDPSKGLLKNFIDLNNRVLERFSDVERRKLGVHTCPGGDHDSTHSADVDYASFLPELFQINVRNFYVQLSSEQDRKRVLKIIRDHLKDHQRVFVGVIDPLNQEVETPEMVKDRVLEAAEYISPSQLGTTDDCGFSPFADDISTSRQTAFEKIRARVAGTELATDLLK